MMILSALVGSLKRIVFAAASSRASDKLLIFLLERAAKSTKTTVDDEIVQDIKKRLNKADH